jgi:hypothetical protein
MSERELRPRRWSEGVPAPLWGAITTGTLIPRVPLRFTRGFRPASLWDSRRWSDDGWLESLALRPEESSWNKSARPAPKERWLVATGGVKRNPWIVIHKNFFRPKGAAD